VEKEWIRSKASASGAMTTNATAFKDDPFVDKQCPGCGKPWPDYVLEGTGQRWGLGSIPYGSRPSSGRSHPQ
jgi:hypothetical protein